MILQKQRAPFSIIPDLPTSRFHILSTAAVIALQFLVWTFEIHTRGLSWLKALEYWDGAWYSSIINTGYTNSSSAFFPLYPLSVKIVSLIVFMPQFPQIAGTLFSCVMFFIFCFLIGKTNRKNYTGIVPQTSGGWIFFLLWPGTFIFHSHHTEALFLLLSWLALKAAYDGKTLKASGFAGLTALTRIQGCFLAVAVALILISKKEKAPDKTKTFLLSGTISFACFCLYPIYQFIRCSNALAFFSPHLSWTHPTATLPIFLLTFIMGNTWQTMEFKWILRQYFAFVMLGGIFPLWKQNKALAAYALVCLLLMPVQGEFANIFRFGAVLFPVLFVLGDKIHACLGTKTRMLIWGTMLALNLFITREYILSRWAY